ncbi:MAG: hypothetical protein ACREEE_13440, partial [Dongiaceae bacterium]
MMSFRSIALLAGVACAAAMAMPSTAAQAAPQILGVVASNGVPTPLTCGEVDCSAHLSAFCLQQNRPAPSHGHPYTVAAGGDAALIATTSDGRTLRLPAGDYVKFESLIGFTSIRASLPKSVLADLDAVSVA